MRRRRAVGPVATHLVGVALTVAGIAAVPLGRDGLAQALAGAFVIGSVLATGWLLAVKVPRNAIGWMLLAVSCFALPQPLAIAAGASLARTDPRLAEWLLWFGQDWAWIPPLWTLLVWLPLHFPDGRLPSARWRWLSWVAVVALVVTAGAFMVTSGDQLGLPNPTAIPGAQDAAAPLIAVAVLLLLVSVVGTIVSLVARSRHGGPAVRAQLRWMAWSVSIVPVTIGVGFAVPASWTFFTQVTQLAWALIPWAIAVAVLKYRLYEIDRIISRTAAYLAVTVVVVGTYLLVVLLISSLIPGGHDRTPPIVIALATLAAAAVFLPALRWIRRGVDRVFNRSQYDAERVVVAFGERIRNGADPHTAGADLVGAVGTTLQPSAIGLWTREDVR